MARPGAAQALLAWNGSTEDLGVGVTLLALVVVLAYGMVALGAARCWDAGHGSWKALTLLVPLLGLIMLFVIGCEESRDRVSAEAAAGDAGSAEASTDEAGDALDEGVADRVQQ